MKLLLFKGDRPGLPGVGDWLVRKRTKSPYSHCEIMFEESDGPEVAALMPNRKLVQNESSARWCFSASATDIMPDWGNGRNRRAGKRGGTRFKQITTTFDRWDVIDIPFVDPLEVAKRCVAREGRAYDWRHIFSFFSIVLVGVLINFFMNQGADHWTCGEVCGDVLGFVLSEILDPKAVGAFAASALIIWKYAQNKLTP